MIENVILTQNAAAPFRSFLFQGHVLDEKGNKMSKSMGNVLDAHKLLGENSVDLVRFYFMWKSSPIESLNFSLEEMATRPYQVMSTLYYLHVYLKQNSSFDKFEQEKQHIQWVLDNNLLGLAEVWLLSKLQRLIKLVTVAFEKCKFHEGAKAIEEFIINNVSQTYVPVTRNDIWDDSEETLNHRLAIYSVLGYALKHVDIMLYPISPFITEYLYLTCFASRRSLLLESWPKYDNKLVNTKVEDAFDKSKEVVSLANSARMKAQLKRRWPLKQVLICSSDAKFLTVEGISDTLKNQLNVENYTILEISHKTELQKILSLLENKMPIVLDIKLVRKNIAPRVKANIGKVIERFEKINKLELLKSLQSSGGKYVLSYEGAEIELSLGDLELSYGVSQGYVMSERDDTMV
ncbi:MAG TPA: class I tRNA ligase family protein, partial [Nitrososphaeraceae archaeon]